MNKSQVKVERILKRAECDDSNVIRNTCVISREQSRKNMEAARQKFLSSQAQNDQKQSPTTDIREPSFKN